MLDKAGIGGWPYSAAEQSRGCGCRAAGVALVGVIGADWPVGVGRAVVGKG